MALGANTEVERGIGTNKRGSATAGEGAGVAIAKVGCELELELEEEEEEELGTWKLGEERASEEAEEEVSG